MSDISKTNSSAAPSKSKGSVVKKKIRKYLYVFLTALIVIVGIWIYWTYFFTYSDGYRAGLLQKFSHKGTIFKTYEGEMILSSVESNKNITLASEKFLFSVANKDIVFALDSLQGKNIVVHYTQKNNALPWRGESPYIVNSVKLSN